MTITARLIVVTTVVLLASCVPVQQPVQISEQPAPPPPPVPPVLPVPPVQQPNQLNQAVLKVLLDLTGIREEIKLLRNSVEEAQFETENIKRRQQDLFHQMERRMASIERNQQVSAQTVDENNPSSSDVGNGGDDVNIATNTSVVQITTGDLPEAKNALTPAPSAPTTVTEQEQQAYDQAYKLLTQSRYKEAIIQFQHLVETWPLSQLAADAYYWMSEARYVNREFKHALNGFSILVNKYPNSGRVPEALLKTGYIQHDIGDYEKAVNIFRDILARFPEHPVAISAQTRLRRIEQTIQ